MVTSKQSQLEYLTEMIPELRLIALGADEQTLAYLLEITMIEAMVQLDAAKNEQSSVTAKALDRR